MKHKILVVDDEEVLHKTIGGYLKEDLGHHVDTAYDGKEALSKIQNTAYDLVLADILMPGMDGLTMLSHLSKTHPQTSTAVITGHGDLPSAIRAIRLGAKDFLTKPIHLTDIDALLTRCFDASVSAETSVPSEKWPLIGNSLNMENVKEQIHQIAKARGKTVLITGETGTGKEVVARRIHEELGEKEPFIAVNCPALTDTLLEAELFGHVKGAFTSAIKDAPGHFEMAQKGVIFLDEIADLSRTAQATLLRVLETRSIRRVGSNREIDLDLCVIAATNTHLEDHVEQGTFRQDLFFRLNAFTISLAPLRNRKEDILPLANHLLKKFTASRNIVAQTLSPDAQNILLKNTYPGNVRELRNLIERAAISCPYPEIQSEYLLSPPTSPTQSTSTASTDDERINILTALEKNHWNRAQTARDLNIPYSTLRYRMQKYKLS